MLELNITVSLTPNEPSEENVKKEERSEEIFSQITNNKKSISKKSIIIVSVVIGIILLLFLFFVNLLKMKLFALLIMRLLMSFPFFETPVMK